MEKAGDFLKQVFSPPADSRIASYLPIFRNWKTIAGPDLEKHVKLLDIKNDLLITETAHPGWKQAVLLRKKAILDRINRLYPGLNIRDVRVNIIKKSPSRSPAAGGSGGEFPPVEEPDSAAAGMEELFSRMTDNELNAALKKLYSSRPRRRPPGADGDITG
jgi:hypothetical protein